MNENLPTIVASNYGNAMNLLWSPASTTTGNEVQAWGAPLGQFEALEQIRAIDYSSPRRITAQQAYDLRQQSKPSTERETMSSQIPVRRIVQVFIADPNENVPLDISVLYSGDQKLTDLTDTELFFEVPIADLLKAHNEKRVKLLDKDATKKAGKDVVLDPVKIRELKMVVVTVASF